MATITSLGFSIFSRFDGSGTTRANRALNRLNSNLNNSSRGLNTFTGRMGAAVIAGAALGPALVPIGTVLAGVTAATVSMGVAAGSAMGVYGLAMRGAIQRTLQMHAAGQRLTASQSAFVKQLNVTKGAWVQFIQKTQGMTLSAARVGLQGVTNIIRAMPPVVAAVHPVVMRVAQAFRHWTADSVNGLGRFRRVVIQFGVPALNHLMNAGRSALGFLGAGFRAFAPLGVTVAKAIERGAAALNRWAQGGGFERFLARVREQSPQVRAFFVALGTLIRNLSIAFARLGPLSLLTATGLLRIVAAMPIPVLQALIVGFVAWKVAMVANAVATALFSTQMTILRGRTIAATIAIGAMRLATIAYTIATRAAALATRLLALAFRATPVGLAITALALLVAAIVWLATKTRFFQAVWRFTWAAIMAYVRFAVGFIMAEWRLLVAVWRFVWSAIMAYIRFAISFIKMEWNLLILMGRAMAASWRFLGRVFGIVWRGIARLAVIVWGGMRTAFSATWGATRRIGASVWRGMRSLFGSIFGGMRRLGAVIWRSMRALFGSIWGSIRRIGATVWRGMRALFGAVFGGMRRIGAVIWRSMRSLFSAVWGSVRRIGAGIWRGMRNLFGAVFGGMRRIGAAIWRSMRALFSSVWGATRRVGAGIWRGMRNLFGAVFGGMRRIGAGIWRGMRGTFSSVWGATRRIGAGIWRSMARIAGSVFRGMARVLKGIWGGIMNAARSAWKRLRGIVASPVKFVINSVIGRLAKTFNSIAKAVHLSIRVPVPHVNFAKGGRVIGPGGPKDDKVPAMLSAGEYVMKASAVKKVGVRNLEAMNGSGGRHPHFAEGGPVMPHMATGGFPNFDWPDPFDWVKKGANAVFGIGKSIGKKLISTFGEWTKGTIKKVAFGGINLMSKALPGGIVGDTGKAMLKRLVDGAIDMLFNASNEANSGTGFRPWRRWKAGDGRHVGYGGVTVNVRTREMLRHAEHLAKRRFSYAQGSYSNGSKSGGTHRGGGAVDSNPATNSIVGKLRASGFASWARSRSEGFSPHIHSIAEGDPTASPQAKAQVKAMFAGKNGLANNGPDTFIPNFSGAGGGSAKGIAKAMLSRFHWGQGQWPGLLALWQRESGWNVHARNRSSGAYGIPQALPANKMRSSGADWRNNPATQIHWGLNYIRGRYGTPNRANSFQRSHNWYAKGGMVEPEATSFDHGGYLPSGVSLVNNASSRPEPVGHDIGVPDIHFNNCTFAGGQRQFETMVVRAVAEAKRKGRV